MPSTQDDLWLWIIDEDVGEPVLRARWLMAQGVTPGDRVAIAFRNYPEWMLAYWGCTSIGVAAD